MKYNMRISPVDDCVWINGEATLMIDGDTPEEARQAALILDNHSQLTKENAKLREVLEMVIFEAERNYGEIDINDLKEELNQLKDQKQGRN